MCPHFVLQFKVDVFIVQLPFKLIFVMDDYSS